MQEREAIALVLLAKRVLNRGPLLSAGTAMVWTVSGVALEAVHF